MEIYALYEDKSSSRIDFRRNNKSVFSRLSQMALSKLDRDLRDESTFRVTSLIFVIASRVRFAKNTIPRRFEFHTGNYCIDREIDTGLKIQRNTKRLLRLN